MFDAIATRYDLLNHLLSAGLDRRWRARAIGALRLRGTETLLDVCTGTADVAIAALVSDPPPARVAGVDVAAAMLGVGRQKLDRLAPGRPAWLVRADATRLPFASTSVDAVTSAFGIRNVEDLSMALREVHRVLRAGGRLAILEFGLPSTPGLRGIYGWYFRQVLPRVGRAISGHRHAYSYLPASVARFPAGTAFAALLAEAGFSDIRSDRLALGIVYLYTAARA